MPPGRRPGKSGAVMAAGERRWGGGPADAQHSARFQADWIPVGRPEKRATVEFRAHSDANPSIARADGRGRPLGPAKTGVNALWAREDGRERP
jgi:hypothetical protein